MNNKDRLQMYVSLTKITIVLCWLSLFSFWAIKLFGGNWFEIMVENENFVQFSNKVQNTWLKYLVSFFTTTLVNIFTFGAIAQEFVLKKTKLIYFIFSNISMWAVVNFINVEFLQVWYGYLTIIIFGFIYQKRWKKLFGIMAVVLELVFSTLSIITRSIQVKFITDYLVLMIMIIDVQIMYALYYLYSNLLKMEKEI
jgi:hypothetical protein